MGDRERVEALAKVLIEEGAGVGSSIHGWRCEYPDRYGPCDCVYETAQAVLDSPAMCDLLAEAKADALREARAELGNALDGFVASELSYGNHNRAAALRSLAAWNDGAGYRIDPEVTR